MHDHARPPREKLISELVNQNSISYVELVCSNNEKLGNPVIENHEKVDLYMVFEGRVPLLSISSKHVPHN